MPRHACPILTSALCRKYWYFDCCCARCSDTTELGSHMSSLVCGRCRQGNTALGWLVTMRLLSSAADVTNVT